MYRVMHTYKHIRQTAKLCLWILFCMPLTTYTTLYTIVFIHLGPTIPDYLPIALKQARLFNRDAEIVLIANEAATSSVLDKLTEHQITLINCESLNETSEHQCFLKSSKLDSKFRNGFWQYTFERFYYLHAFISQHNKKNVFHLEYDNMLYCNLEKLLPIFEKHYSNKIGVTFDNDERCIPGFVYISDPEAMQQLISFMTNNLDSGRYDMYMIGLFKQYFPLHIINLPIIPESYTHNRRLRSSQGHTVKNNSEYFLHYDDFNGIFDAAALGQYLGGIDPRNGPSKPGFINESCIFDPSQFTFSWRLDSKKRKVPYLNYKNMSWRIINLHIHSKNLIDFTSFSTS